MICLSTSETESQSMLSRASSNLCSCSSCSVLQLFLSCSRFFLICSEISLLGAC